MKHKTIRDYIRDNGFLQAENKRLKEENEKSAKMISDLRASIDGYIERASGSFSRYKEHIVDTDKGSFDLNFSGLTELFPGIMSHIQQQFHDKEKGGVCITPPEAVYKEVGLVPSSSGGYYLLDQDSGPFVVECGKVDVLSNQVQRPKTNLNAFITEQIAKRGEEKEFLKNVVTLVQENEKLKKQLKELEDKQEELIEVAVQQKIDADTGN